MLRLVALTLKPAGVAWVISDVVTRPRFQPASPKSCASVRSFRWSGRVLMAPLTTREPEPQAEAEAAESVTSELSERTFIKPQAEPGCRQRRNHESSRFRTNCEN